MAETSDAAATPTPQVIIIGAGLVGLTLAQALKKQNIRYSIFERDTDIQSRKAGWGITIHWGLPILRSLVSADVLHGLDNAGVNPAAERAGDKGNAAFYNLQTGIARFKTPAAERRRVKREKLRSVLVEGVDVQWSKQLVDIRQTENEGVVAVFADGTAIEGSLVVGCDGAHSIVRSLLVGQKMLRPMYRVPVRMLGVTVVFSAEVAQPLRDLDPYFLQGGYPSNNTFLYFSFLDTPSSNDRDETNSYTCQIIVSWPLRPPEFPEVPASAVEQLKMMKSIGSHWAEPFRGIVMAIPEGTSPMPITPEDWSPLVLGSDGGKELQAKAWAGNSGNITLAGDAAHTMTMYRGEAFNHGLKDVESLLHHIGPAIKAGHGGSSTQAAVRSAIDGYEAEMVPRGELAVMMNRQACLDAHEQTRVSESSPLIARRVQN